MARKKLKDFSDYHQARDLDDSNYQRIKEFYKNKLKYPSKNPEKQYLLCLIGLVGSGKSTVIKPLCKKLHLLRVAADEIRQLLYEECFNMKRITELTTAVIDECLGAGYSVAIDSDSINAVDICEGHSKKHGIKIFWVHINPPEKFIINKLKKYKHTWLFKDADDAIESYNYRKKLHENLSRFKFIYTFDPSKDDLPKQIVDAAQKISQAAK